MITPGQHVGPAGDLGVHAVGAAISKLSLISALGCVAPSLCVPILTDFGTSNEELLSSQFYVGLRQPRADASVVESLMQELMDSIERRHGNNVMLFLEDMQYPAAKKLLSQYRCAPQPPLSLRPAAVVLHAAWVAASAVPCSVSLTSFGCLTSNQSFKQAIGVSSTSGVSDRATLQPQNQQWRHASPTRRHSCSASVLLVQPVCNALCAACMCYAWTLYSWL